MEMDGSDSIGASASIDSSSHNTPINTANKQYVTFEPDHGGWNNIRMAMEVVLVFAFATGRTLVMPPEQGMYLLNKGEKADDNKLHFSDFFYLHRLQETMELIEMDKFLEREGVTGNLGERPPDDRTDLAGRELWSYLDKVSGGGMRWNPFKVRPCGVGGGVAGLLLGGN